MRAGKLRHRITLQQPGDRVTDTVGGGSTPYVDVATISAEVMPLEGTELFEARKFNPKLSHNVKIRYRTDVKASWRVKFKTRFLEVKSIINTAEQNHELILSCEEFTS
jgi:SPP1 family predicted phage head-tail adaptor